MRKLAFLAANLILASKVWATPSAVIFETLPLDGTLPLSHGGQTEGWGYTIINLSSDWFVPTYLGVNSYTGFASVTPIAVYDRAPVAPGSTLTVPFSMTGFHQATGPVETGLFGIEWNTGLPAGTHETGIFVLYGDFWSGTATSGPKAFDHARTVLTAPYDATAPEPSSTVLFGTGGCALAFLIRRHRRSPRRRILPSASFSSRNQRSHKNRILSAAARVAL